MPACPACGAENADSARFCSSCGAGLAVAEHGAEVRKTVTIVFSDVTGSTSLGEQLDPELLRRVMSRYFDEMRAAVERHGGVVEKFIGDAVMAVFGIPQLHEDDALRAVRAALDMREALTGLNEELGVELKARTGVNTGEVVAGDPSAGQRLVTGDPVNVAARLEQAAMPGQILVGAATHQLVRDAVHAESVEPLELKGKSEPVEAFMLHSAQVDVPAFTRRLDAPFVGRERELAALQAELERSAEERACRLVTVLGPAGIGKSRLVRELVTAASDRARVVVGRCLPYGEGITFWPIIEIVRQLGSGDAGTTAHQLVLEDENASLIAERIAAATGEAESAAATEETFWAIRKLFEALARERPLIILLDDIQWAEPTFLDLIEYLLAFSSGAPILLVCVARAELLDTRPAWTAPRPNAVSLLIEPLTEGDADELIERLLEGQDLSSDVRERILTAAEGNPLFVEQMLALHAEHGNGQLDVPPTIQALLASRIDRLEPDERGVIERASIEGRLFHRGAVAALAPERVRPAVATHLLALVRKELVRPDRAEFAGDDGFRFGHILIRDAAYTALPKELRAELHERYADWLERKTEGTHGYAEIVGYHLEQAHHYRCELGAREATLRELGERAGLVLGAAGERALARLDTHAAANLIERALALLPEDGPRRDELRFSLGDALVEGADLERGVRILDELADDAGRSGDVRIRWHARLRAGWAGLLRSELSAEEAGTMAEEAVTELGELGDDVGLALAWQLASQTRNFRGDIAGIEDAMEKAYFHSIRAGADRLVTLSAFWLGLTAFFGSASRLEAIATCNRLLEAAATPIQRTDARFWLGAATALGGDAEGLDDMHTARRMYFELGMKAPYGGTAIPTAHLEALLGKLESAERTLREANETLAEAGEKGYRSTVLIQLADVLCDLGRFDESEQAVTEGLALGSFEDVANAAYARVVRAKLALTREEVDEAERLAREAAAGYELEQSPASRADGLLAVASIFRAVGRPAEAHEAASLALELYEQKGAVPGVERARALLSRLEPA
ncbi:MAG: adenylate/guanylate cyclase domain-containing protein [Gaiellaceae bacterium]